MSWSQFAGTAAGFTAVGIYLGLRLPVWLGRTLLEQEKDPAWDDIVERKTAREYLNPPIRRARPATRQS